MNPQFVYVEVAISAMRLAMSEQDLIQWWIEEKLHREKWRLSPEQDPGKKLFDAFKSKRTELKGK